MSIENLGPVYDLLKSRSIDFTASGKDFLVRCLNPNHEDSSPSMRIDRVTGATHCFSCGFKANIFKYFGIFTNPASVKVARLKEKIKAIKIDTNGLEMLDGAVPFTQKFRGISAQTLKKFGAFTTHTIEAMDSRIIFPITDLTGKIRLFIGRHTLSNANPRYIILPNNVQLPLFPPKLEQLNKCIILVEGIFDFLNIYDKGMTNAVCTFGTNTLTNTSIRSKLLPFKAQGVTHIYIMFDGDEAGVKAAAIIKPLLEEAEFIVEVIKLTENTDPGQLSQEDVTSLIEYTQGKLNE